MADYLVRWEIELSGESPLDAIEQAIGILADPHNTATIFEAFDSDGNVTVIDMEDPTDPYYLEGKH